MSDSKLARLEAGMGKVKAWVARAIMTVVRWAVRSEQPGSHQVSGVVVSIAGQAWTTEDIRKFKAALEQARAELQAGRYH